MMTMHWWVGVWSAAAACGGWGPEVSAGGPPPPDATPVWVFFEDKGVAGERLAHELDALADSYPARAIERRARRRVAPGLFDARDLPVSAAQVARVRGLGVELRATSRWLNAVSVTATPAQQAALRALEGVAAVQPVRRMRAQEAVPVERVQAVAPLGLRDAYGLSAAQLEQIEVRALHAAGVTGAGVVIGVLDTGFRTDHAAFGDALHGLNVLAEWDFVDNDPESGPEPGDAASQHEHGTYILGVLAAYRPNELIGAAYGADFILCKTEDAGDEYEAEEDYYVAGLEFIELHGGDVATSSLGYTHWYQYSDMDGETAVTTVAVNTAIENGLICVTAAGNGGTDQDEPTLIAPGDAFEVLTCGAVDENGVLTDFSSGGPTFDGRIKPELLARGQETASISPHSTSGYSSQDGTSMSTPLVAGAVALLLDAHPDWGVAEVRGALLSTASDFVANGQPDPQSRRGWGIVNALAAAGEIPACPEDIDGDGTVDLDDLLVVLGHFGQTPAGGAEGDVSGDGTVDLDDLLLLLGRLGEAC